MFWVCTLVFQVSKPGKKCWKLGHGCRGDKKPREVKVHERTGRQAGIPSYTASNTYRDFLYDGGAEVEWRLHNWLIPPLWPLSSSRSVSCLSCFCKVAFPKEALTSGISYLRIRRGQVNLFYIVNWSRGCPSLVNVAVKVGMWRGLLCFGPFPQEQLALLAIFTLA